MKKIFFTMMMLFLAIGASTAHADNVWNMAKSSDYKTKLQGMIGRGMLNVVTSPLDIMVQTVEKTQTGPPLVGTLTGLGSGLGCTALRVGSGIVDVATFWAPDFNGFPVSRDYSNCLLTNDAGSSNSSSSYEADNYSASATNYGAPISAAPSTASAPKSFSMEPAEEAKTAKQDGTQYVKGSQSSVASDYNDSASDKENTMKYVK